MSDILNRTKKNVIDKILENDHALLHVDSSSPGTSLPQSLMNQHSVTLKISRLFRGDLELQEDKIRADLLFNGSYFTCLVPYANIWGVTDEFSKSTIWTESVPEKVLSALAQAPTQAPSAAPPLEKNKVQTTNKNNTKAKKASHLTRIK